MYTTSQWFPIGGWDYSLANIDILLQNNIKNTRYIKIVSPPTYVLKLKEFKTLDPHYDIGFCGSLSTRRKIFFEELQSFGLTVNVVRSWGDCRDRELAKCRIILNVHYDDDFKIFELARCEPWLQANFLVVSEKSLDDDLRCVNVDYQDISKTCLNLLNKRV